MVNMFGQTETTGIVTVSLRYPRHRLRMRPRPFLSAADPEHEGATCWMRPATRASGARVRSTSAARASAGATRSGSQLTANGSCRDRSARPPGRGSIGPGSRRDGCRTEISNCSGGSIMQIKVRGFRIEPGEIEAALNAVRRVPESVVLRRRPTPEADRGLNGSVACSRPGPVTERGPVVAKALRESLKRQLPDYMLPAAIVEVGRCRGRRAGKWISGRWPAMRSGQPPRGARS